MIKMQVIGHLGKDAVVNNVNGKSVINFAVAHTEKYKDATGNLVDKTIWVDCAYWTDRTAVAPYMKKGTQIHVDGAPDVKSYTTADGRSGSTLSCRVINVQLLGSKPDGQNGAGNDGGAQNYNSPSNTMNNAPIVPAMGNDNAIDDLPF